MPGLDSSLINEIDKNIKNTVGRILTDIKTDFILAPHYSAIYAHLGNELWDEVKVLLRSGKYEPDLPITIEVPKKSGLTRPGSILSPKDRVVYQAVIDLIAPIAEKQLDRTRVFSQILLDPDPDSQMFQLGSICWQNLQKRIEELCLDTQYKYAIKADVASFFETLYQHNLINLLHASMCPSGAINFLESLLLAWMEKNSHGILQGIFPSDYLGNFYLLSLDSSVSTQDVPSVRYVDDIYIFYSTLEDAQKGLVDLCKMLRHEGLHLNESKSRIIDTGLLLREETALDRLFQTAREEVESEKFGGDWYGFQTTWENEDEFTEQEIELLATEALYNQIDKVKESQKEKIEKFCLPIFTAAGSTIALEHTLSNLFKNQHLGQVYCAYLSVLAKREKSVSDELIRLFNQNKFSYDWHTMWLVATLLRVERINAPVINLLLRTIRETSKSVALRALCALVVAKHGHAGQRKQLRHFYSDEPSEYVRSAILFASRYFPTAERKTCLSAWSGHSAINSLIARAVQKIVR